MFTSHLGVLVGGKVLLALSLGLPVELDVHLFVSLVHSAQNQRFENHWALVTSVCTQHVSTVLCKYCTLTLYSVRSSRMLCRYRDIQRESKAALLIEHSSCSTHGWVFWQSHKVASCLRCLHEGVDTKPVHCPPVGWDACQAQKHMRNYRLLINKAEIQA